MARILTALRPAAGTVKMLQADIADGAPTNADGTMNLVHYAAWLVKEMAGGRLTRDNFDRRELVRLLNSTPLGEVIGERQLLRHRSRAGFRIGDGRHIDLFRYVAWLVDRPPRTPARSRTAIRTKP